MTTFKQFLENEEYQPVRIKLNRRTPPSSIQDQFIKIFTMNQFLTKM